MGFAAGSDNVQPLDQFNAVGAGQNATLSLPAADGLAYASITFDTNQPADKIERFRLFLNGDSIIDMTGSELKMREKYLGLPAGREGLYTFSWREPNHETREGRDFSGLVTMLGDTVTCEVKLAADASNPTIKAFAETYQVVTQTKAGVLPAPRTHVLRVAGQNVSASSVGRVQHSDIVKGPRIKRIHIGSGVGVIDNLEIKRNQLVVFDCSKEVNDHLLSRCGLVPQDKYFHYDPTREGFPIQDLEKTQSSGHLGSSGGTFVFYKNVVTSGVFKYLYETIEGV